MNIVIHPNGSLLITEVVNGNNVARCIEPGANVSGEAQAIVDAATAAWTPAILQSFSASKIAGAPKPVSLPLQARYALERTSVTMERIIEGASLGTCAYTNADVVAFMNFRKKLRAIVSGTDTTSASLPIAPPPPAGT